VTRSRTDRNLPCIEPSITALGVVPFRMKLRIVIADDNLAFCSSFASLLQNEFDIVAALTDGGLALEAIRSLRPDVAVLDLKMPALDGIQLTKRLKRESHRPAVVIALSKMTRNLSRLRNTLERWAMSSRHSS